MAVTLSNITLRQSGTFRSNETTGDFTPEANALLLAWASLRSSVAAPATVNIGDSASLSWITVDNNAFNTQLRAVGWYAIAPSSPSAMSIWFSASTAYAGICYSVSQATGHNAADPVVSASTVGAGATSTTPGVTVSALASSGNLQCLFVSSVGDSSTPEAGWSESADTSVPALGCHHAIYTIGTPGDTTPSATLNASRAWRARALEIAESIEAAVGVSTALRNTRRRRR